MDWEKAGLFVAGVAFGSAGFKLLGTKEAKKAYIPAAVAGLKIKDYLLETADRVQETLGDILAEATEIKEAQEAENQETEAHVCCCGLGDED